MSESLSDVRQRLDAIDRRIVDALADRLDAVREAASHKTDGVVRDPEREEAVLNRLTRLADQAGADADLIETLYRHIFDHSVRCQKQLLNGSSSEGSNPQPGLQAEAHTRRNGHAPASPPPAESADLPDELADKRYTLASRLHCRTDTHIQVGNVVIGNGAPVLMAGPCSVESRDQIMACAETVADAGGHILRGGCFKPRTSPYSFQGLGFEGLDLMAKAGRTFGLPIVTEVMHPDDVEAVAAKADILQLGARNMQNFELLKAVGRVDRPVLLKRGMMATIDEWLNAAEYILAEGNERVILCQRGIRTFESATRYTLDLTALPVVRERTHLPVIVDPSHASGCRRWVPSLAEGALAAGADGVMVEMHPNPEEALSDGPQSLTFDAFRRLSARLHTMTAPPRMSAAA